MTDDSLSQCVTLGIQASDAFVSQNVDSEQFVRLSVRGEAGYYMLMATATGVSLYDVNASRTVHFAAWDS